MKLELEAIGQQPLQHFFPLLVIGPSRLIGLRGNVELVRVDPGRRTDDLLRMQAIG
jgi:hypothetical protein